MKAALLNKQNEVIAEVFDAPEKDYEIEIAGAFTSEGQPANVRRYKISRSKKNLKKAAFEQPVSKVTYKNRAYYTFHCVENNTVVY